MGMKISIDHRDLQALIAAAVHHGLELGGWERPGAADQSVERTKLARERAANIVTPLVLDAAMDAEDLELAATVAAIE